MAAELFIIILCNFTQPINIILVFLYSLSLYQHLNAQKTNSFSRIFSKRYALTGSYGIYVLPFIVSFVIVWQFINTFVVLYLFKNATRDATIIYSSFTIFFTYGIFTLYMLTNMGYRHVFVDGKTGVVSSKLIFFPLYCFSDELTITDPVFHKLEPYIAVGGKGWWSIRLLSISIRSSDAEESLLKFCSDIRWYQEAFFKRDTLVIDYNSVNK